MRPKFTGILISVGTFAWIGAVWLVFLSLVSSPAWREMKVQEEYSEGTIALEETCRQAIPSHLWELAETLETGITCRRALLPQEAGLGGVFYAVAPVYSSAGAIVIVAEHVAPDFYAQIAAHELGHAWMHALPASSLSAVCDVLGTPSLARQSEYLADVVAVALGHYVGDWRTSGPRPTPAMLSELVRLGLVPLAT